MTSFDFFLRDLMQNPSTMISVILGLIPLVLDLVLLVFNPKLLGLIFKNLGRNVVRTALTCLAIMVLVFMVTLIWTVVFFLNTITRDQAKDLKVIVTERWQLPSQMPMTYSNYLDPRSPSALDEIKKYVTTKDFMCWSFYGGTLDPQKRTIENLVFFFVMEPDHIISMMDDMQNYDPALIEKLKANRQACLIGKDKMKSINKQIGERFKLTSINYKGIDLEFEIVGTLPEGRYDSSAIMNAAYFNDALDKYREGGRPHPLSDKRLNLIWLRVPDKEAFARVAAAIESSPNFTSPQVKCEAASSAIGAFLDVYRDLILFMEWFLVPAILASMALVVSNAIGISVRERIKEIAVLKVLGYRPGQILILVLGESMMVGGLSGLAAAGISMLVVNVWVGGIKFPIGFFPAFLIPLTAIWWGLAIGFMTSFLGSIFPALTARSVKVSEVFSKVT